jgi:ankyrin repeat protein
LLAISKIATQPFSDIISKKNRGQNLRAEVLPLTSPIALDKDGIHEFAPICNSFNQQELTVFLQEMQSEVFSKSPGSKSMIISGSVSSGLGGHTITIGYDPEKEEWCFINSNEPITYTKDPNIIAKLVMEIYQHKEHAHLAIDIYGLQSEKDLLEKPLKEMETKLIENLKINPTKLTDVDSRSRSLLMQATQCNYQDWVTYFLNVNANPNQADEDGYHLLSYALSIRNITIINLLLDHGVDPNITMVPNKSHYVPLWYGISIGDANIVATLLMHGANPNQVLDELGFTPMHLVAQSDKQNRTVIFDLLIQYGGDIDKKNKLGSSSFDMLTSNEDRNIVQLLAEKNAKNMLKMIKQYIKATQWELKWPGGEDIKVDNQIITVPTYVKLQWDQIERAKANEINFRNALKEVIRIGKEVPESSFRLEKTTRYYSIFKAPSRYTIEKQLIEEVNKTHHSKK